MTSVISSPACASQNRMDTKLRNTYNQLGKNHEYGAEVIPQKHIRLELPDGPQTGFQGGPFAQGVGVADEIGPGSLSDEDGPVAGAVVHHDHVDREGAQPEQHHANETLFVVGGDDGYHPAPVETQR
jgi:hypothetical protein